MNGIDRSARVIRSSVGEGAEIRENCTLHDSSMGKDCRIFERVSLKKVLLGNNTVVNTGSYLEYAEAGDDVLIGPNCSIVGVFHRILETGVERADSWKRVVIKRKAFIGAGSVILPGVEVGEGSVIGAGSTVASDVPAFHIYIYLGVPPNQTVKSLKEYLKEGAYKPTKVLFVCYGNAARSVMAKYFCNILGGGVIIADSAGIHPFLARKITAELQERVIRKTIIVMEELGIDVSSHKSKHIGRIDTTSFDVLVNMSPMTLTDLLAAYAPNFRGKAIQWHIQDPANKSIKKTRIARDMLNKEVVGLIKEINSGR